MTDIPANSTTSAVLQVGDTLTGQLEVIGDRDWYRLTLNAGQAIRIDLSATGQAPVQDTYLRIRDASGNILYENDDSGGTLNSTIAFSAPSSGTYYVEVGAYDDASAGTYLVSVSAYQMPPEYSFQQIADQLVNGYWRGDDHHFNVTPGGSLTVNVTALTPAGQTLARAALAEWSEIIGVRFVEVSTGGQITFDDDEEGAHAQSSWSGGIISSSRVNVSTEWLANYGTGLNSYSFQTYLHEVGHALGLGHAGHYNNEATYPYDALFRNDSWAATIMSYFSQRENSDIAAKGFDYNYIATPMIADILAMSMMYGLSTTTRTGNTTYGPGEWHANMGALCIFDSGGLDTIDCSGFGGDHLINLNPGTYSNVLGERGNVSIALNTIIENAIGGAGADTLVGNDVANRLEGRAGNDTLTGGAGDDVLDGGIGADTLDGGAGNDRIFYDPADVAGQVTGGAGNDLLLVENLAAPKSFNLTARSFEAAEVTQRDAGSNPWSTIVELYNGNWGLVQQTTTNDNASRILGEFDPTNILSTNQVWSSFDTIGRLSSVDQLFDIGTRTFINVDEASNQAWRQDWFAYDAQGRLDSEDVLYDSGAHTFINLDQANSHSWSQAWFSYDALGRLDTQDVINDDGSHIFTNYDQAGTEAFQYVALLYNSAGSLYQQVTAWDNGTLSYTSF